MKKNYVFIILIVMCFNMNKTSAQVFTSGFESWTTAAPIEPTDWYGTKTSFVADSALQDTTAPHGGMYNIKLISRSTQAKRLTTLPNTIALGTTYTFTFWVKGHGSIRTGIYTGGSNNITAYKYGSFLQVNSSSWSQKTQTIASDTSSTTAQFILSVRSTVSDLEDLKVDDVQITTASTPTVSIHDIQYANSAPYASPYNTQIVITGGIVSAKYNNGMFIQSGYGPWSGLYVFDSTHIAAANITMGDSVIITGTVSESQTYTELKTISNVTKVSSGNTLHAAFPVSLVNLYNEELEGVLVSLNNLPCVDTLGLYTNGAWIVYNGVDSTHIGGLLYKYPTAQIGTNYDITGVVYLVNGAVMRVEPRGAVDVSSHAGIYETIKNTISLFPNPATTVLNISNMDGIDQIEILNVLGEKMRTFSSLENSIAINVNNLPKGIYFVSLLHESSLVMMRKFIKE